MPAASVWNLIFNAEFAGGATLSRHPHRGK